MPDLIVGKAGAIALACISEISFGARVATGSFLVWLTTFTFAVAEVLAIDECTPALARFFELVDHGSGLSHRTTKSRANNAMPVFRCLATCLEIAHVDPRLMELTLWIWQRRRSTTAPILPLPRDAGINLH
jgi:hypothetical protein